MGLLDETGGRWTDANMFSALGMLQYRACNIDLLSSSAAWRSHTVA